MVALTLIVLLAAWFALSVWAQVGRGPWLGALRYYDVCGVVPSWSFFAPRPGTSDLNLLYRDRLVDGQLTPWREIALGYPGSARWAWNPHKRRRKCVVDLCQSLQGVAQQTKSVERVLLQLPYIALLNYVSGMPRNGLHAATQFMVVRTFGPDASAEPDILFVSSFHALS